MKIEHKVGLVRGVVEIQQDHGSFEPIKAYTFWFRHDEEDLEKKVANAIDRLLHAYSNDRYRYHSAMMYTEWKGYR